MRNTRRILSSTITSNEFESDQDIHSIIPEHTSHSTPSPVRSNPEIIQRLDQLRQKLRRVMSCQDAELQKPVAQKNLLYLGFLHKESSALKAAISELEWILAEQNENSIFQKDL